MGEKENQFEYGNIKVEHNGQFFPLGKIESARAIEPKDLHDGETIGIDMTGFRFGTPTQFTMELQVENPLRLELTLLGIQVVNVILCKNCAKQHTHKCRCRGFGDYDTCSRAVLREEQSHDDHN